MTRTKCDVCGEEHEKLYSKTCDACYEALGLLPEEVKWMLLRIIENRIHGSEIRKPTNG